MLHNVIYSFLTLFSKLTETINHMEVGQDGPRPQATDGADPTRPAEGSRVVVRGSVGANVRHWFPFACSPNQRSLRGPGGVGRGVDSRWRAKICALELASVASRGPPVDSRLQIPKSKSRKVAATAATVLLFIFASYYFYDIPKLEFCELLIFSWF